MKYLENRLRFIPLTEDETLAAVYTAGISLKQYHEFNHMLLKGAKLLKNLCGGSQSTIFLEKAN